MNDDETFVRLKYRLITPNPNTWELCKYYPKKILIKWTLRCILDIEENWKENEQAKKCIFLIQEWMSGENNKVLLDNEIDKLDDEQHRDSFKGMKNIYTLYAIENLADVITLDDPHEWCADAVDCVVASQIGTRSKHDEKFNKKLYDENWNRYIQWLIEELAKEN